MAFLLAAILIASYGSTVSAYGNCEVKFVVLPEDSPFVGTYYANFSNLSQYWSDSGEYKDPFLGFFINTPRVHINYLNGHQAFLILSAKSGWHWVYDEGSFFVRSAWILEKE